MPIPASLLNPDGTISHINNAAEILHKAEATQLLGKNCHTISHPQHFTQEECPLCQAIYSQTDVRHKVIYCQVTKKTLEYTLHFMQLNERSYILHFCLDVTTATTETKHIDILPERVKLALKSFNAGMYEWNMLDNSAYVSNEWKIMLGYNIEEPFPPVTLDTWKTRVHPDDIERIMQNLQKTLDLNEEYIETTHRLKHKDGHYIWILGRGLVEYDENHTPQRMIGMHTDISEQITLQQKSTERRKILDNSLNEIYIFSAEDLKFLYLNYGAKHNVGYSFTEISKLTPLDLNPNIDEKLFLHILESNLKKEKHTSFSSQCQRKNGSIYDVDVYLQETIFEGKKAYVAIVLDITERKKAEALIREQANSLYYLAHYDMLTDLANRVLLTQRLQKTIQQAKKKQSKVALFFIDIDKFKQINDIHGHYIGDQVLKEIAKRLKKIVPPEDTIARFGGDEFIILTENTHALEELTKEIKHLFNTPILIDTLQLYIACSLGMSIYPDDAQSVDKLLIDADKQMYLEKRQKR
jgi:diguanylate cyclase (GGDEF)-like protein/PAS domain S-box-containing protein